MGLDYPRALLLLIYFHIQLLSIIMVVSGSGSLKLQFIRIATAKPKQIESIVFRRKTIECIWFDTAVARQQQDLSIGSESAVC